MDDDAGDAPPL